MWVTASGLSRLQTTPGQAQHPDDVNVGLLFLTDSGIVRLKTTTTLQLSETIWTNMTERWWRILSCVCVCVVRVCKGHRSVLCVVVPSRLQQIAHPSRWSEVSLTVRHHVCTSQWCVHFFGLWPKMSAGLFCNTIQKLSCGLFFSCSFLLLLHHISTCQVKQQLCSHQHVMRSSWIFLFLAPSRGRVQNNVKMLHVQSHLKSLF